MKLFQSFIQYILTGMLVLAGVAGHSQLYNTGSLTIASGGSMYVAGALQNTSTSDLRVAGDLYLTGSLTNDQLMLVYYGGNTRFVGSSAQTLSGASAYYTSQATFNTAGLTLSSNSLWIDGTATFTNGIVNAASSTYPLVFTTNGNHAGASDASHVNGWAGTYRTGSFIFPVGNTTKYQPVGVNLSANVGGFLAQYNSADAGTAGFVFPLTAYNKLEYWSLNPVVTAIGTATIYWDAYNNVGVNAVTDLVVAHKPVTNWQSEGAASSAGTLAVGSVTSNALLVWGTFALGSNSTNSTLPVRIVSFDGVSSNMQHQLSWTVGAESQIRQYVVERSYDGGAFAPVGTVAANLANGGTYHFNSLVTMSGEYRYRLRIEEESGTISYSKTILLRETNASQLSLYPNPAGAFIVLQLPGNTGTKKVEIFNMLGEKQLQTTVTGAQQTIAVQDLLPGIYEVKVEGSAKAISFVKQ